MVSQWRAEVRGMRELQRASIRIVREMQGPKMVLAMGKATLLVVRTARQYSKIDTGRYRASITPEVVVRDETVLGIVGTNVAYAPFVVFDTKPHFPPLGPILEWVKRQKIAGRYSVRTRRRVGKRSVREREDLRVAWAIARKISRVGTKGDYSLPRAVVDNEAKIVRLVGTAADAVLETWGI